MGFSGGEPGPEHTRSLLKIDLKTLIYIYFLTTNYICRVLMLHSIRVEAEFAEERTEAITTTISSLWRSDRGEFSHYITWKLYVLYISSCAIIGVVL